MWAFRGGGGGEEKGWAALTPDPAVIAHRAYVQSPDFS
jgi:hypothetical protein